MLNNLTTKFQEALMQAQQTAGRLGKPEISSLDVLVALLEQEGGILSPILRKASCDPGCFSRRPRGKFPTNLPKAVPPPSPRWGVTWLR